MNIVVLLYSILYIISTILLLLQLNNNYDWISVAYRSTAHLFEMIVSKEPLKLVLSNQQKIESIE